MKELIIFLCLGIHSFAVADGPCAPKQVHLSLGDSFYFMGDSFQENDPIRQGSTAFPAGNQVQGTGIGNDLAKIVWVTLKECSGSYVNITKTNSSAKPQKYCPRTEYYSQYINYTFIDGNIEGQYTRYSHIAELTNIEPDTLYTAFLNSSDGSATFNFKIPHLNRPDAPLKILFYADIDCSNASNPTRSRLQSYLRHDDSDINLTFFGGDVAYEIISEVGERGDIFFEQFQPLWTTRPMMMTPGNHDDYYNFSMLNYRMKMPLYNLSNNHYYSWNIGSVHFLTFNYDFYDYANLDSQIAMYKWVEKDLIIANSTENRMNRPWIILFVHRPIYCSQSDRKVSNCTYFYDQRKIWDDLISSFKVDMYIAGHLHNYERMGAIANNRSWPYEKGYDTSGVEIISNPSAPIHVLDGSSGDAYFMRTEPYLRNNLSEVVDIKIGISILTIYNSSVLGWKHIKSDDESVIDQFYIKRDRPILPSSGGHFDPIMSGMFLLLVAAVIYTQHKKKASVSKSALAEPIREQQINIQLRNMRRNQLSNP